MRKLLSFALVSMMVLSLLAACGSTTATTAPTTSSATTAPAAAAATTAPATVAVATTAPAIAATVAPTAPAATVAPTAAAGGDVDPSTVTGDIISAGSSTVFPLSEAVAEVFKQEGYTGNITIDSVGTGAGFERFCTAAETDIANASRAIKDTEAAACRAKGREPVEFRVGTDALAVVVSAQNTFVTELSEDQLANIYSGTLKLWSDVDASYPKQPIKLYSPGTDSGTFDYFVERLYKKEKKYILGANPQLSEDDNVLVKGVEDDQYAIGYFGYAYFNENKGKLKALSIDGVEPTAVTAEDGTYPLARPLYIYSSQDILAAKPQVGAFISFYLANVNDLILDVGYFPASDEALAESMQSLTDAMNGTSGTGNPGMAMDDVDPSTVTGDIISAGSSTVFPLSEAVAEVFKQEGYTGNITIDSVGTGAGFERFCTAAETDIANASRAIKDTEAAACRAKGREPVEFRVGTDALAVVVSAQNTFVTELSEDQLANIYSGTLKLWSDVDASYPKQPIKLYSPGTDSGTFDYFVERLYKKEKKYILGANPQLSEDDNVLVKGVEDDQYAIGYFGYAYFNENKGKLKALSIDGVEPTAVTAEDGTYPLARPLYIYSSQDILAAKPQVGAFISFYLANVNDLILDVGYFPASDEALAESMQSLMDSMK